MEITFLIAAYNEARTIAEVLDRIAALGLDYEAIVVDDGSTDTTAEIVCQRTSGSPHWRPSVLPGGGHLFSPLVAIGSPRWSGGFAGA